ncbi:MAG: hypothetical protein JNK48_09355 [Bryobacterales bacterium]|nr:hypothetical protein [Bryobacterales bacterium]
MNLVWDELIPLAKAHPPAQLEGKSRMGPPVKVAGVPCNQKYINRPGGPKNKTEKSFGVSELLP